MCALHQLGGACGSPRPHPRTAEGLQKCCVILAYAVTRPWGPEGRLSPVLWCTLRVYKSRNPPMAGLPHKALLHRALQQHIPALWSLGSCA